MSSRNRAKYGAEAFGDFAGNLPQPFPRTMGANCLTYLKEVVESGLQCDMVGRFEAAFAREMGVKHCIGTPGCTAALNILVAALDLQPGDEIIASPITDYGTVMGLLKENFIPVFPDTEPGTPLISTRTIAPHITDRTRAILAVHITGLICDMDPIRALAKKRGLTVIEDVCQAAFGTYKGRLAGTLGDVAAFSFDSEKTLGSDVGGCAITNDGELAERIRFIGQSRGGQMVEGLGRVHAANGYALRMTQSTAAITLAQLEIIRPAVAHLDRMIRLITDNLGDIPGIIPLAIPDYMEVYSCWMAGFRIDPAAFRCDAESFARQVADAGLTGAGLGKYYLMPAALPFLTDKAEKRVFPFSKPPASHTYRYRANTCPNARDFLNHFIRWTTFCEKYQPEHCDRVAQIVAAVADQNRV